jgi:hypothetical protein
MAQRIAFVCGALLAVMGVWGFIQSPVFGIFNATSVHSALNVLIGATLLAVAAWYPSLTALSLKLFGILFALLAIAGFSMGSDVIFGVIDNTLPNSILTVLFAIVFLYTGFFSMEERAEAPMQSV